MLHDIIQFLKLRDVCGSPGRLLHGVVYRDYCKTRLFTKKEGGEQHCQIGNHMLAINEILEWMTP